MAFNFKNVHVQKEKYVRRSGGKPRGQKFRFKFRPNVSQAGRAAIEAKGETFIPIMTHEFKLCREYFENLDIKNHSIAILVDEDPKTKIAKSVALAITPEKHRLSNTYQKKGEAEKSEGFSNHFLMLRLVEAGILEIPELDEKGVPVDLEDDILGTNQYLDIEKVGEVQEIDEKVEEGYMVPVEDGEGIPIYEIVQGEEIVRGEGEDDGDDEAAPALEVVEAAQAE